MIVEADWQLDGVWRTNLFIEGEYERKQNTMFLRKITSM